MTGTNVLDLNLSTMNEAVEFYLREKLLDKEWSKNMKVTKIERVGNSGYGPDGFKVTLEELQEPVKS